MPSFVLFVGLIASAACAVREHFAAAVFLVAWNCVLALAARRARTWSDE